MKLRFYVLQNSRPSLNPMKTKRKIHFFNHSL